MNSNLKGLLEYAEENNFGHIKNRVIKAILKYSADKNAIAVAHSMIGDKIEINLSEMKSLMNSEKFDFPDYEIGMVGVEDDE
jgi:hypothetical protein